MNGGPAWPRLSALLLLGGVLLAAAPVATAVPPLQTDTRVATAGYFRLSWPGEGAADYVLQQGRSADFRDGITIYSGPDEATVLSGLADGDYYYRLRERDGRHWSDTVSVEVRHHPLSRALGFFTLGAVMFLATLGVLIRGTRSNRPS